MTLLLCAVTGGWAAVTDLPFTATKKIASGGEIWWTTSTNVANANSLGWCSNNGNASNNKYGSIVPNLSGDVTDVDPAYHKIDGVLVKGGNTPSDLTTSKKCVAFKVTNTTAITAYAATTSGTATDKGYLRWYIYDASDNSTVVDGVYGEGALVNNTCTITKDGLEASKTYIVNIEGGYKDATGTNQDCVLYAVKFSSPSSGKEASSFTLTSEANISLWKGQTSTITYSGNAGTVTFTSSNASVAEVSSTGVINAVGEGSAIITITDPGTDAVDGAESTVNVTVNEHKNTTTINIAAGNVNTFMDCNSVNESSSLSGSSSLGAPVTLGTGAILTLKSSANNFQKGGKNMAKGTTKYLPFKAANGTYTLELAEGYTLTSAKVYAMSNSTTGGASLNGTELPGASTDADMTDDTKVKVFNITSTKEFTISGGQTLICVEVEYNNPKHMSVTIKETGYATLYTDYAVAIPTDVNAYTTQLNAGGDALDLVPISGTIPANTAVILYTETPGTYLFVAAADAAAIPGNQLKGVLTATDASGLNGGNGIYTLGLNSAGTEVGMRSYTGTSIRAYSAYMDAPAGAAREFFGFGETTGINSIEASKKSVEGCYNLAGQRVAQPTKGLYIVNGKKVIIK